VSSVTDAFGSITQYGYDPANNLATITDANSHTTSFQYDNLNRRNLRQLPLGMTETSMYDAVGNLLSKTDFNGKTTTYTYDSLNRLLSKTPDSSLNQPAIKFSYTATGQRATMQDASGATTYKYDNRDRLITKAAPEGTLSYSYDAAGNLLTMTSSNANGASLSYTYDADDRLATVTDNRLLAHGAASGVTSYSYDPVGNLSHYTYPNTIQNSFVYDTLNRVTTMQSTCGTASGCTAPNALLASFSYTLDPVGNRTKVVEPSGRNVGYQYDNDYRLTTEAITGDISQNGTIAYTYDPVGNRTQVTSTVPAIPASGTLAYDANDRSTPDSYDANGNLLSSGTGTNLFDFENKLVQDGGANVLYDGDGNRVSETVGGVTTSYLVDTQNPTGDAQVVDELVNGSVSRTYAYGGQRISQNQLIGGVWTPSFYGYDAHGSVRYLGNLNATITDTYEYDAFGNLIASAGSTPNNYLFSGEQFDSALGLYQLRARWYRPATGRFISRDPEEGSRDLPLSFNPYIYTSDNPVNRIDPTGRADAVEVALEEGITIPEEVPAIIALGLAIACVFNLTADELAAVLISGKIERTGPCTAKPGPSCKTEYPNLIPVGNLFDYPFESEGEAFAALQAEVAPQQLKKTRRAPATGGPCAVGGQYDPGWHINVPYAKGGGYAGSLVGCPCCDDSSGTPEPTERWGIR
jgi:RHS repeat-associated protein